LHKEDNRKKENGVGLFRCYRCPEIFVLKDEGADGADLDTFSAFVAGCVAKQFVLESGDPSLKTPSGKADHSDTEQAWANALIRPNCFLVYLGQGVNWNFK